MDKNALDELGNVLPSELIQLPQWVVHRAKQPYDPKSPQLHARAGDPATWSSFSEAVRAAKRGTFDGVGFEFNDNGIVGIDIDHCLDEQGNPAPVARKILELTDSYTEISPSGTGLHIYVKGSIPTEKTGRKAPFDAQAVEMYYKGRYFTVTGNVYNDSPIREVDLTGLYNELYNDGPERPAPRNSAPPPLPAVSGDTLKIGLKKSETLKRLYYNTDHSNKDESSVDMALMNSLAYWCNRDEAAMIEAFNASPWCQSKDAAHQRKAMDRADYLHRTAEKAINGCNSTAAEDNAAFTARRPSGSSEALSAVRETDRPALNLEELKYYSLDDMGTAKLFSDTYKGKVCYVPELKRWYAWDGRRWNAGGGDMIVKNDLADLIERVGGIFKQAQKEIDEAKQAAGPVTVDIINEDGEPGELPEEDFTPYISYYCKALAQFGRRKNIISDSERLMFRSLADFDKNSNLFNCQNCTLDLSTGVYREQRPEDFITKMAAVDYNPAAHCPRWNSFISEITEEDGERADYLQRAIGYALDGSAREECFFIAYGKETRNGKSTFFTSLFAVLGDYAGKVNSSTLARHKTAGEGGRPRPDLLVLQGKRLALCDEPNKGLCLDEAIVKRLTGNDVLLARPLYSNDAITFTNSAVMFISANDMPRISDDSLFRSDRVKILSFPHHFDEEERDVTLKEQFQQKEAQEAIFLWALEGLKAYRQRGLKDTSEMRAAVRAYQEDNDHIKDYIGERLAYSDKARTTLTAVSRDYRGWCYDNGITPMGSRSLKQELAKHGIYTEIYNHQYRLRYMLSSV